jgi:hypothetical protein
MPDLTTQILRSMAPYHPLPSLESDTEIFSMAVCEVTEALANNVITEQEAEAVIALIARQFAGRRVYSAMSNLSGGAMAAKATPDRIAW